MARFQHVLFVCTHERQADDPRGSCKARGSEELLDRLKALVQLHGLKGKVRVTSSGCLDYCAKGCTVAAFSADAALGETWYTKLTANDAEALFESHVRRGECLQAHAEPIRRQR